MKTPAQLKAHLETCRRLGIRYVSLTRSGEGIPSGLGFEEAVAPVVETLSVESEMESPKTAVASPVTPPAPSEAAKVIENQTGLPSWLTSSGETIQAMELMAFDRDICECQKCPLGATRKKFVFGSGSPQAEVMFVGEAPGADEDAQGLPFVGKAGQLLTKIIESTQTWKRPEVFICNVLKCRPPGNRTPLPEEVDQCRPYLEEQIRVIQPKLLMALGASAAQALLRTKDSVGKLRNRWHEFQGIPLRVTYHPAALLRFDGYKKDVWEDMKELTAKYQQLKGK